jgi:hypothetical protein
MKIKEYLSNPLGKGSALLQVREMVQIFDARYEKNKDRMTHRVYRIKKKLYFHIKVPSSIEGIHYDVVIKFIPDENEQSLMNLDFQVFSNCPSFIFTYANAYYKRGLIIPEIKRKLTKEAIRKSAEIRNPHGLIGYEYSIYLALKYIMKNKLYNIEWLGSRVIESSTVLNLYRQIQDFESLMKRRNLKEKAIREKEREERQRHQKKLKYPQPKKEEGEDEKGAQKSSEIKHIQNSKRIRSTKTVKKSKKK